jgi:hypothetical protein
VTKLDAERVELDSIELRRMKRETVRGCEALRIENTVPSFRRKRGGSDGNLGHGDGVCAGNWLLRP